ncbi:MAG: hypothetical protein ACOX46_12010 [Limnochordia bacterium]
MKISVITGNVFTTLEEVDAVSQEFKLEMLCGRRLRQDGAVSPASGLWRALHQSKKNCRFNKGG